MVTAGDDSSGYDAPGAPESQPSDSQYSATPSLPPPSYLRWEIFVVFAVSLGASGLNALLDLVGALLSKQSLSSQQALLVGPL